MAPSGRKLVTYALVILLGILFVIPSLLTPAQLQAMPEWLPKKQIALGLDLKGGAHLVLEMDVSGPGGDQIDRRTAIEQSIEIVRKRIDAVGVAEPTVQALGTDRILVQPPGVQDPAEIRTLLGSTAKLTFHRMYSGAVRAAILTYPTLREISRIESSDFLLCKVSG